MLGICSVRRSLLCVGFCHVRQRSIEFAAKGSSCGESTVAKVYTHTADRSKSACSPRELRINLLVQDSALPSALLSAAVPEVEETSVFTLARVVSMPAGPFELSLCAVGSVAAVSSVFFYRAKHTFGFKVSMLANVSGHRSGAGFDLTIGFGRVPHKWLRDAKRMQAAYALAWPVLGSGIILLAQPPKIETVRCLTQICDAYTAMRASDARLLNQSSRRPGPASCDTGAVCVNAHVQKRDTELLPSLPLSCARAE